MTRPIEAHFPLDDHGTMGRILAACIYAGSLTAIVMHSIVRASLYVATGGVVVGGSVLTIPTAPVLAVAGVAAGTIILVKCVGRRRKKRNVPKE